MPAKPFHGRPADIWAAGVTLAFIVSGQMPFWGDNMPEVWRQIREDAPMLAERLSPSLQALLKAMLAKEPNDRPTVAALRQHPWVTQDGADPMPKQEHLPLQITDDDVQQAVKRMTNTFTLVKAGKKWKRETQKASSARLSAQAAEEETPAVEAVSSTAEDASRSPAAEAKSPKSRESSRHRERDPAAKDRKKFSLGVAARATRALQRSK